MKPAPLAKVRVVVTRPEHQAEPLVGLIEQTGGEAIRFPLLEIKPPREPEAVTALLQRVAEFDLLIFISRNAVDWSQAMLPQPGAWPKGTGRAAIGAATARRLQHFNLPADLVPSDRYDSEGLLTLPELQDMHDKNVLIIRGEGGRESLREGLERRGARVSYVECYRRCTTDVDIHILTDRILQGLVDVIVLTSVEALDNLFRLAGDQHRQAIQGVCMLVISQRLAQACRDYGCARLLLAERASDEEIVQALREWKQETDS